MTFNPYHWRGREIALTLSVGDGGGNYQIKPSPRIAGGENNWITGVASMRASIIEKPLSEPIMLLAGVFALIAASCTSSEAGAHKAGLAKAAAQQEKPIKLRYYGGPKSPMYPE
jgi:hypothetical protein